MKDEHRENLKAAMKVIEDFQREFYYVSLDFSDIDFLKTFFTSEGLKRCGKLTVIISTRTPGASFCLKII